LRFAHSAHFALFKHLKEELNQYEAILNQETLDIYNCVTGKEDPPKEIRYVLVYTNTYTRALL